MRQVFVSRTEDSLKSNPLQMQLLSCHTIYVIVATTIARTLLNEKINIITKGRGKETLKAYLEKVGDGAWPRKLPQNPAEWPDGAMYNDAVDHGFLTVWADGSWMATFSTSSLVSELRRIPHVVVTTEPQA